MKTENLIRMLATNAEPVKSRSAAAAYAPALGAGALGSLAVMLFGLDLGFRTDLQQAIQLPMFWVKLTLPLATALLALAVVARLSRPGTPVGRWPMLLPMPSLLIWVLAALSLLNVTSDSRPSLILGSSWAECAYYIAIISLPSFGAAIWAIKQMAPIRLAASGAAAGMLAGGIGATVYAFHCSEMEPAFLAIWYVLGMLIPGAAGAAMGRWLLRW